MSWLAPFGFLSPYWLALFPLGAAALVYAYLRRGRGNEIPVGTTFLLKALTKPVFSRKKFRPPLRFYLELLLLMLLAAGSASFYREGAGSRVAVVVDNSFSMAKSSPGQASGADVLSLAIAEARSTIGSYSSKSKIDVFKTTPQLLSLSGGLVAPDRALAAVGEIGLSYGPDNIEAAAAKLAANMDYDKVIVLTDHTAKDLSTGRLEIRSVHLDNTASPQGNVALVNIALKTGTPKNTVEVTLASFVTGQIRAKLQLDGSEGGGDTKLTRLAEKSITLTGRAHDTVVFPNLSPLVRIFRARLVEDGASLGASDLIRQDDTAWMSVEVHGGKIAVVSQFSPAELGLDGIHFADFAHLRPEAYDEHPEQISSQLYLGAIFHRYVPLKLPKINSAFIAPVSGSPYLGVSDDVDGIEITRWQSTHPALSYLNMPSLKIPRSRILTIPPWGHEIINSTRGPIAFAGELAEHRYVASGFELLPFEGKKSPLTSIFTLNVLKYLSDLGASVGYQSVGAKLLLPSADAKVSYFDGEEILPDAASGSLSVLPQRSGLVRITPRGGEPSFAAFNYFDENESDTLNLSAVSVDVPQTAARERHDVQSFAGWLAAAAAVLLLIDLVFSSLLAGRPTVAGGKA